MVLYIAIVCAKNRLVFKNRFSLYSVLDLSCMVLLKIKEVLHGSL